MAIKKIVAQIQCRQGTESERVGTIFDIGEPVYITDTKKTYIGDGVTLGGVEISGSNNNSSKADVASYGNVKVSYASTDGEVVVMSNNDPRVGMYSSHVSNISGNPHGLTAVMIGAQPALGYVPEDKAIKGIANGYAGLDETGKVPTSQLPALQQISANVFDNEFSMLTSMAKPGDVCVRTDITRTYILKLEPASELSNWIEILSPSSGEYPENLTDLTDAKITTPIVNNSSLVFNSVSGKWENKKLTNVDIGSEPVLGFVPENVINKSAANGYAGLDSNGKINLGDLPLAVDYIGFVPENSAKKDVVNGYPGLDSNGKISPAVIPSIAITDTFVAISEYDMLHIDAQVGDICIRPDTNKTYILKEAPATTLLNWLELALTKTSLALLGDTSLASVQDGQCLVYSGTSNKWINRKLNITELGQIDINLNTINDVNLTLPSNNQTLVYKIDTHEWINKTMLASDVGAELAGAVSAHTAAYDHAKIHDKLALEHNGAIVNQTDNINFISSPTLSFDISSDLVNNKINIVGEVLGSTTPGPQGPQGYTGNDGQIGPQGPQGVPGESTVVGGTSTITRYVVETASNGGKSYVTATGPGAILTKVTGGAILEAPVGVEILSASVYFDENEATASTLFIDFGKSKGCGENTDYLSLYCPQFQVFQDVAGNRAMKAAVAGNLNSSSSVLTISSLTAGQAVWVNINI